MQDFLVFTYLAGRGKTSRSCSSLAGLVRILLFPSTFAVLLRPTFDCVWDGSTVMHPLSVDLCWRSGW